MLVLMAVCVLNTSSFSLHLKHDDGGLRSRYMSLGIEWQFFNMENA